MTNETNNLAGKVKKTNQKQVLNVSLESIPQELKERDQWLVWKAKPKENGKINKPPYQAKNPTRPASKNNEAHWATFDEACSAYTENSDVAGIGYVATLDDGLVFFDLDDCFDDGKPNKEAQLVIDTVASYTEKSPSGKGLRIVAKGSLPGKQFNNRALGREMYDGQKFSYLTITGHVIDGMDTIEESQKAINGFYAEWDTTGNYGTSVVTHVNFEPSTDFVLSELGLACKTVKLIKEGMPVGSRSEAIMTVIHACLHRLVSPGVIVDILTDQKYGISEKAWGERGELESAKEWMRPQVEKAVNQLVTSGDIKVDSEGNLLCKSSNEKMNEAHGVLNYEGKTVIVSQIVDDKTGFVKNTFRKKSDFVEYHSNQLAHDNKNEIIMTSVRNPKPVKMVENWLGWNDRNTYPSVTFLPEPNTYATNKVCMPPSGKPYNLWHGFNIKPNLGNCSLIKKHLLEIWCSGNEGLYTYLWNWLARMLQFPQYQAETAIVVRSGQGTGKNIIIEMFVEMFGVHATTVTSPEQMLGRFSGHLDQCVFLFSNEAIWGGNKAAEGALKAMVSDKERTTEEKYMPVRTVPNYIHLMIATNNDWALPVDLDDRRFLFLDVLEEFKNNPAYFEPLIHEIENGGREALMSELVNTDISSFKHRVLPKNQGASRLGDQMKTADSVTRWWYQTLLKGEILALWCTGSDWEEGSICIEKSHLHSKYLDYCQEQRINYIEDMPSFMRLLYERFGGKVFKKTRVDNKNMLKIADIETARASFAIATSNTEIDWE